MYYLVNGRALAMREMPAGDTTGVLYYLHSDHLGSTSAATCPAAMIFVAGEHGGISHTPREFSTPAACAAGVTLLANAARRLADQ